MKVCPSIFLDTARTSVICPTECMKVNLMRFLERGRAMIVNPQATSGVIPGNLLRHKYSAISKFYLYFSDRNVALSYGGQLVSVNQASN